MSIRRVLVLGISALVLIVLCVGYGRTYLGYRQADAEIAKRYVEQDVVTYANQMSLSPPEYKEALLTRKIEGDAVKHYEFSFKPHRPDGPLLLVGIIYRPFDFEIVVSCQSQTGATGCS